MTISSNYRPRPGEATFGYFNTSYSKTINMKKTHKIINLMNGLGYIPIVGLIVGIARITFFNKLINENNSYSKNERTFARLQVTRGVFEMLSLGAIFLILDLIFTINREMESAMHNETYFCYNFGMFKGDRYW